eukprot:1073867-Rhodomonas_salina.3
MRPSDVSHARFHSSALSLPSPPRSPSPPPSLPPSLASSSRSAKSCVRAVHCKGRRERGSGREGGGLEGEEGEEGALEREE